MHEGAIHERCVRHLKPDDIAVSLTSVYNKLNGLETHLSAELVRFTTRQLEPVLRQLGADGIEQTSAGDVLDAKFRPVPPMAQGAQPAGAAAGKAASDAAGSHAGRQASGAVVMAQLIHNILGDLYDLPENGPGSKFSHHLQR